MSDRSREIDRQLEVRKAILRSQGVIPLPDGRWVTGSAPAQPEIPNQTEFTPPQDGPPDPKRLLYERLDRGTGWFDTAMAIHMGEGFNKGITSKHAYGKGMIRAIDGETGEPVWVQYAWNLLGIVPGSDGRLDYWQVTLDAAGKWFSENRIDPHALWFEDRRRGNPARPPRRMEPPAAGGEPTNPAGAAPEQEDHAPGFVPPVDQLVEIHQALWSFHNQMHSSWTPTMAQEDAVLPFFVRLAEALRPVRPLIDHIEGWPTKVGRALPEVIRAFDATARRWGWEGIAQPEPSRSAYLAQCRDWVREGLERPMYEAALAVSACWEGPGPCLYDDMADEARRRGMVVTMGLEEGLQQVELARTRFNSEPHLGKSYPRLGEPESTELIRAFNMLHPALLEAAPEECSRPPWQQPSAARPEPAPAPNASPSADDGQTVRQPLRVICPLHGIRTLAIWQKGLADLASSRGWVCRLDRWSYGRFSLLAFFTPWTRETKLNWLRRQYDAEIHDRRLNLEQDQTPSVVAHSFGTYILGYTLLRFDFIRFNKVILCGSILPTDFPWDQLIERGQVQAVRNEYGVRDIWVKRVRSFVRGTGPSGAVGFSCRHERLEQEEFEYDHGDYFGVDHVEDRWIPFLNKPLAEIPRAKDGPRIPRPQTAAPWGLYVLALAILVMAILLGGLLAGPITARPAPGHPGATARRDRQPDEETQDGGSRRPERFAANVRGGPAAPDAAHPGRAGFPDVALDRPLESNWPRNTADPR